MIQLDVVITDPQGVHALVAQNLATVAKGFASSLFLRHQGRTASLDDESLALATISAMLGSTEPDARADLEPSPRPGEPT